LASDPSVLTCFFLQFSHSELLDFLAKKTVFVLEQVHLSKTEGAPFDEMEELRGECEVFVKEVIHGRLSLHAADIKLMALHSRIRLILSWCLAEEAGQFRGPIRDTGFPTNETLEKAKRSKLLLVMFVTEADLDSCVKEPSQKDLFGPRGPGINSHASLAELLHMFIKKTALILDNLPDLVLQPQDGGAPVTLGQLLYFSLELQEMQNRCHILEAEAGDGQISSNVAYGTLLGIHERLRTILIILRDCFYGELVVDGGRRFPAVLTKLLKHCLIYSMSRTEESVKEYISKD
jgi:hypothetical protein